MLYRIVKFLLLSELVDVKSQLRFQIASFVFVNDVHFSQLIQHLCNAWYIATASALSVVARSFLTAFLMVLP